VTAKQSTRTGWCRWAGFMTIACLGVAWLTLGLPALAQENETAGQDNQPTAVTQRATTAEEAASEPESLTTADTDNTAVQQADTEPQPAEAETTPAAVAAPSGPKDPTAYDLWVLLPALIAILLAIFTRQVVPALIVGVFAGAYMLVPCLSADDPYARLHSIIAGFRLAAEKYIVGAITDPGHGYGYGHVKIIVFTLVIGFTVGVIGRNGGTEGMVRLVTGKTSSPRRGALTAWFAGLVIFFDDYANTMIVGPTMRSVFDRLKLSRAKLAYIVDSTAAPVASIALIGTWIGAEIGFIQEGLNTVTESGTPEFLIDNQGHVLGGMEAFIQSIPYRFYPILALLLVFLIALTGRDFGPMKRSERKVLSKIEPDPALPDVDTKQPQQVKPRWWLGLLPVLVLVAGTVWVLAATGLHSQDTIELMNQVGAGGESVWAQKHWWMKASDVLRHSDSYLSIFYGAVLAALSAVLLTLIARACSLRNAIDAGLDGMAKMFPAMVILVLAWALSGVLQDLRLGDVVVAHLRAQEFPAQWLPLAIFITAAVISFATGTSWGTMGILCPATVTISAHLVADLDPAVALSLFYASVGSVLAGAVFGDHCSPISDTTILSSIASGCRHEEHVWTQIPYAFLAAIAAMGLGDVMCSVYQQPWYYGLGAGAIFLILALFIIGRRPVASFDLADA